MKHLILIFFLILGLVANLACRENPIGPDNGDLHLSPGVDLLSGRECLS